MLNLIKGHYNSPFYSIFTSKWHNLLYRNAIHNPFIINAFSPFACFWQFVEFLENSLSFFCVTNLKPLILQSDFQKVCKHLLKWQKSVFVLIPIHTVSLPLIKDEVSELKSTEMIDYEARM